MLASRVHGHEDARVLIDLNSSSKQLKRWLSLLNSPLDDLDLLRYGRELFFKKSVKLIEATPGAALDETDEYSAHRLVVKTLIAVED
jgi:hypothetical protein